MHGQKCLFSMPALADTYLACKATSCILTSDHLEKFTEELTTVLINNNKETISTVARQETQNLPVKRVSMSPVVAVAFSKKAKVAQ